GIASRQARKRPRPPRPRGAGWARAPTLEVAGAAGENPGLVHLDADALRLRLGPLGDEDPQDAVLLLGGGLVRLEGGGEREAPGEHAVAALDPVVTVATVLALQLPLAPDGQHAVLQANVDVLRVHLREVELERHALGVLEHVRGGRPAV